MDELPDHPAIKALRSFLLAMNGWGWEMVRIYRSPDWDDEELSAGHQDTQRRKLEAIFAEFCEAGAAATRLKDVKVAFTDPPEYDPEFEPIVGIARRGDAVVVRSQNLRIKGSIHKYEMIERSGAWLVRAKKFSFDGGKTWRKDMV